MQLIVSEPNQMVSALKEHVPHYSYNRFYSNFHGMHKDRNLIHQSNSIIYSVEQNEMHANGINSKKQIYVIPGNRVCMCLLRVEADDKCGHKMKINAAVDKERE
ncbi:hypothetical protein T10_7527 [Trichinella papuae]|uniref:Uncharacterized protein n=1 Tax=Trichinella papuae TaxID=268474 RepID=A0A0V1M293_9BILA|nr:hypothetical protein T10_7527 [Trichinella papuae]